MHSLSCEVIILLIGSLLEFIKNKKIKNKNQHNDLCTDKREQVFRREKTLNQNQVRGTLQSLLEEGIIKVHTVTNTIFFSPKKIIGFRFFPFSQSRTRLNPNGKLRKYGRKADSNT